VKKSVVYHFVNLLTWETVYEKKLSESIIYFDSLSIVFLARLVAGKTIKRKSGLSTALDLCVDEKDFFLLPKEPDSNNISYFIIPNLSNDAVCLYEYGKTIANRIPDDTRRIFLGISGPKQDLIANGISQSFGGSLKIYCLGASVDFVFSADTGKTMDQLGFTWLLFLIQNPSRGVNKIYKTILGFFGILLYRHRKIRFKSLVQVTCPPKGPSL